MSLFCVWCCKLSFIYFLLKLDLQGAFENLTSACEPCGHDVLLRKWSQAISLYIMWCNNKSGQTMWLVTLREMKNKNKTRGEKQNIFPRYSWIIPLHGCSIQPPGDTWGFQSSHLASDWRSGDEWPGGGPGGWSRVSRVQLWVSKKWPVHDSSSTLPCWAWTLKWNVS